MRLATTTLALLAIPAALSAQTRNPADDGRALRSLHAEVIRAHAEHSVEAWMRVEADTFVNMGNGRVTFPGAADRRGQRAAYLDDASFTLYHDIREPIVRISDDGTLGWLIAEVEIEGSRTAPDGRRSAFHDIWAWVELYARTPQGWKMVGNAATLRP